MVLETADNVNNGNPSPLEALLAGAEGFPPMLDIPPDADDETMVELAIALSLQQDQQGERGRQPLPRSNVGGGWDLLCRPGQGRASCAVEAGRMGGGPGYGGEKWRLACGFLP